jgi:hypothetical protein
VDPAPWAVARAVPLAEISVSVKPETFDVRVAVKIPEPVATEYERVRCFELSEPLHVVDVVDGVGVGVAVGVGVGAAVGVGVGTTVGLGLGVGAVVGVGVGLGAVPPAATMAAA